MKGYLGTRVHSDFRVPGAIFLTTSPEQNPPKRSQQILSNPPTRTPLRRTSTASDIAPATRKSPGIRVPGYPIISGTRAGISCGIWYSRNEELNYPRTNISNQIVEWILDFRTHDTSACIMRYRISTSYDGYIRNGYEYWTTDSAPILASYVRK